MRRGLVWTVLAAMLMANVAPAMAQMKPRQMAPRLMAPKAQVVRPHVQKAPRQIRVRHNSAALAKQFMAKNPGAKVIGVKPGANGGVVITFRKGNVVSRANVGG